MYDDLPLDPVSSIIRTKEDLAMLDLPSACANVLPRHVGSRSRLVSLKLTRTNTDADFNSQLGSGRRGGPISFCPTWCLV